MRGYVPARYNSEHFNVATVHNPHIVSLFHCVRALLATGGCLRGDGCPFSHDVISFYYIRYNDTGHCGSSKCPFLHRIFEYVPPRKAKTAVTTLRPVKDRDPLNFLKQSTDIELYHPQHRRRSSDSPDKQVQEERWSYIDSRKDQPRVRQHQRSYLPYRERRAATPSSSRSNAPAGTLHSHAPPNTGNQCTHPLHWDRGGDAGVTSQNQGKYCDRSRSPARVRRRFSP